MPWGKVLFSELLCCAFQKCVWNAWTDGLDYFLIQGLSWTEVWIYLHMFWTIRNLLYFNETMNKFWMLLVPASLISIIYQYSSLALSKPLFSLGRSYLCHPAWSVWSWWLSYHLAMHRWGTGSRSSFLSQEGRCQKCDVLGIIGQQKRQYLKEWWEEWVYCEHIYGTAHM